MSDVMIEMTEISRFFGPTRALAGVNLQVKRGEVVGFLGPNGAGKTTAMRILAGILAPTSGGARVAGIDLLSDPVEAKAKVGYLPESPPIYADMSVREYLAYLASLRRVPRKRRRDAVDRAMTRCGLDHVADRLLGNLSKGYRQRAGIAQAIVHDPQVVILDEPTVGLDPIQIREIRELIRNLGGEHSVLLSTHILPEVQMTCHRAVLIHNGTIVSDDTLEGLENRAKSGHELFVRLARPPEVSVLKSLPGIRQVEALRGGWRILVEAGANPAEALVKRSVEENWGLSELTPASHSLEEVFVNLTTREPQAVAVQESAQ
ncbi:MAG: ABC transporter ATP-binding protein [Magnetococcales bacterium]|nr:ABC transporter ATP-binding protein [Magnetococcales bacterium]MBF0156782.1 ABC transporter ATP-binding protein [Magnetococcales bacterium]